MQLKLKKSEDDIISIRDEIRLKFRTIESYQKDITTMLDEARVISNKIKQNFSLVRLTLFVSFVAIALFIIAFGAIIWKIAQLG